MVWHPRWLRWPEAHALSEANSSWQARVRALLSVLGRCLCHRRWWSSLPAQLAKQQPDAKVGVKLVKDSASAQGGCVLLERSRLRRLEAPTLYLRGAHRGRYLGIRLGWQQPRGGGVGVGWGGVGVGWGWGGEGGDEAVLLWHQLLALAKVTEVLLVGHQQGTRCQARFCLACL